MYRSVVDTQQEMVARYLPDTTLTFVNDAYCRSFGKSPQELLGRKFLDFTPPELHDEIIELIRSLTPENPSVMHEHYVFAADGSIRWEEWTDQALFTETGEIKEYQGVGRDITERVLAEEGTLRAYDETIEGWSNALELRDEETEGHSQRVTEMTLNIARMMNVKTDELVHVRRGALLHDIGKMGIPDAILLKPGKLTVEEWAVMRKHPVYAYDMLAPIDYLRPALDIPYCHHEKFDGTGYPRGLKGEEIPLPARIFAVVDVYDALTSDRPYRKAWSKEEALKYIHEESGTHFDPDVVEVFLKTINAYNGKI
jgi:PAS domain S-box-containing protein/putative nucleotidyltransferase with HDIG domain